MAPVLDRQTATPLGEQLTGVLRQELEGREHGSRFYGDREVCERYDVSLPVVRKAMANLVQEGLIVRRRSRGTFVCKPRRVQRARTGQIAVVCPLHQEAQAPALHGIQAGLAATERGLVMVAPPQPPLDFHELARLVEQQLERADGVIVVSPIFEMPRDSVPELDRFAQQLVLINADLPATRVSTMLADYRAGSFCLTRHLIESGRRRIAFVGAEIERPVTRLRLAGYRDALRRYDIAPNPALVDTEGEVMDAAGAREAVRRLLTCEAPPDGIVVLTDYQAIGVVDTLREAGLRVPEDVAVTGFDNRDFATHLQPSLTTAQLPYRELGLAAAELLLQQLSGDVSPGTRRYFPCPLFIRESTRVSTDKNEGSAS